MKLPAEFLITPFNRPYVLIPPTDDCDIPKSFGNGKLSVTPCRKSTHF